MTQMDEELLKSAYESTKKRFINVAVKHAFIDEVVRLCAIRESVFLSESENIEKPKKEIDPENPKNVRTKPERSQEFLDVVRAKIKLPSLPGIFSRIVTLMGDSKSSSQDFANVIMLDPTLSANLLKLVNSAFYGFRHKIDTISDAVSILGTKELYAFVLSMSVMKAFKEIPKDLVDLSSFWMHSIACGIVSRIIAEEKHFPETERFFIAGLLHDIGRLIIYKQFPAHASDAFFRSASSSEPLFKSEYKIFNYDHAKLGGAVLKYWKLSNVLVEMVMYHHVPEKAHNKREVYVVQLADFLVNAMKLGSSGERLVPPISSNLIDFLDVPASFLEVLFDKTDAQIIDVMDVVFPG